ncbi:hypothetical protein C8J56DRAFT_1113134, partial [Mycena floridula]
LRPTSNLGFVDGYPGIPPGPDRPQAAVKGVLEFRTALATRAKWVRIELRKIETLPGDDLANIFNEPLANIFNEPVGPYPVDLWSKREGEEWSLLSSTDFPFSISIPESIPPSIELEHGAGIQYALVASVCTEGDSRSVSLKRKPNISTMAGIIINKHELHSTWPVYSQPERRAVTKAGMTLTVERNQTCYGPGDRITANATVKSDSLHMVTLEGFEMSLRKSTIFGAGPYAAGKKAVPQGRGVIVAENKFPANLRLNGGIHHTLELGCTVPLNHTTVNGTHFIITYTVVVKALMEMEKHLEIELPVVMSNWRRGVSVEAVRCV